MAKAWKWLLKLLAQLSVGLTVGSSWLLVGMMALIFVDVIGRFGFSRPLPGVYEFTNDILLPSIIFLGIAGAEHVRVRVFIERLGKARPIVNVFNLLITMGLVSLMTWQATLMVAVSFKSQEASDAIIAYPIYPARCIVALGLFVFLLVLVASFAKTAKESRANAK